MKVAIGLMFVLFLVFSACTDHSTSPQGGKRVFYTSFERPSDTTGWLGISSESLTLDPAPWCGLRGLKVYGGCIQPSAMLTLGPFESDGYYRFAVWARVLNDH